MSLSEASNSSTIEDTSMNRQTIEDVEGQPISTSKSLSGTAISSPRNVAPESRGAKRRKSTEKDLEEERLDPGEGPAREAKRPKLHSVFNSLKKSVDASDYNILQYRMLQAKFMLDMVHWAEEKSSEGSNESDRQRIECWKRYTAGYMKCWGIENQRDPQSGRVE